MAENTGNDITAIVSAWRTVVDAWKPLAASELHAGDTVYGHIEENLLDVRRVVLYGEPFTINTIDDNFWRNGDNPRNRRRLFTSDTRIGEVNYENTTRLLVVMGDRD